jgi:hypothetical protein
MRINLSGRIISRNNPSSGNLSVYNRFLLAFIKNQKAIIAPTYINYGR